MLAKAFTEISTVLRTALLFLLGTVAMAAVIFAVLTGFLFTSRG
jgi:hypothetical protein